MEVRVLEKRFNDQCYRVSYHARLRYTMRIDAVQGLSTQVVRDSVPYTLSGGYKRGFVNFEEGVVFLVRGDTIATTVPIEDFEFSEDDPECRGCGARVQSSCGEPFKCRFCGRKNRNEVRASGSAVQKR
jgi:hypothetical protein